MAKGGEAKVTAAEIVAAARRTGERQRAHSPLYWALWDLHDEIAPALDPPARPNWAEIAATFTAGGVFDAAGNPPKPVRVRQTWHKVRKDKGLGPGPRGRDAKAAETSAAATSPQPAEPAASPPPLLLVEPAPDDEDEIELRSATGVVLNPKRSRKGA